MAAAAARQYEGDAVLTVLLLLKQGQLSTADIAATACMQQQPSDMLSQRGRCCCQQSGFANQIVQEAVAHLVH
jgi:hypothetical protein